LDPASPEYEEAFWQEQEAAPYWTVPIAHGGEMPWLKYHERGLLVAIQRAHQLGRTVLLIGFTGSPWTLACYMVAGGSSGDDFFGVRKWLYSRPDLMHRLLDRIASVVLAYCRMQAHQGAQAMMVFDSWGGLLAHKAFETFSQAYIKRIIDGLAQSHPDLPTIVFVKGGGLWLEKTAATGCSAWVWTGRPTSDRPGHA
jgi:uroporphyrinogen decarboxylase